VLLRPAAADDRITIAASLAYAVRTPALEELFFYGVHPGNFALEVGNPNLEPEHARGFDTSFRWRSERASGEVTYFRNSVDDFIFRSELTPGQFEAREDEFAARYPDRAPVDADEAIAEGFRLVDIVGADSVLHGFEGHADFQVTSQLLAEVGADYVRGTVRSSDDPLPRIPPFRLRGGLRYQRNAFQAGGEVASAAKQDRIYGAETPTEGYTLLKLFSSYSFNTGRGVSTVTARLDNATDTLYRNHLSLIKDLVPEMGINFKLLYSVRF
jgi:iron complex outermembrane receptor protein